MHRRWFCFQHHFLLDGRRVRVGPLCRSTQNSQPKRFQPLPQPGLVRTYVESHMYRLPRNCPTGSLLEWCNVLTTWPTWQHMVTSSIQQHPSFVPRQPYPGLTRALPVSLTSLIYSWYAWPRTKASAEPMDPAATGSCQGLDGVVMSFMRPWKVPRGHEVFKVAEGNFRKNYVIIM